MCIRDSFTAGRKMVLPEDVQSVLPAVARHRLQLVSGNQADAEDIRALIHSVGLA